jgi:alpha-D-xyloside xylohydrolase
MIKVLHEKYNTKIMISVWPKFYEGINTYKDFEKKGWHEPKVVVRFWMTPWRA